MSDHTPQDPQSQLTKVCTACKQEKPATPEYFTRTGSTRDGLHTQCKECRQKKGRERWAANADELNAKRRATHSERSEQNKLRSRKWWAENRDRELAKKKQYYQANREKDLASSKAWREANPEKKKAYDREYAQKNKKRVDQKKRRWANANSERIKAKRRGDYAKDPAARRADYARREARKRGLPSRFGVKDWRKCLQWFDNSCVACGSTDDVQMDHWIPLNNPGCTGTIPSNIAPLCKSCNASKQNKDAQEWLVWKFGRKKGDAIAKRVQAYFDSLKGE